VIHDDLIHRQLDAPAVSSIRRRRFLQGIGIFVALPAGAILLQACGGSTTPAAPAAATSVASAPTVAPSTATSGVATPSTAPTVASTPTTAPSPAATAPAVAPSATSAAQVASPGALKDVPRNRTLILVGVPEAPNQFTGDVAMQNPFLSGITRSGFQVVMEPLYYYNSYYTDATCGPPGLPCKNGEIPWLATGYSYNQDFTQLTVNLRKGMTWSDGQPFSAGDVAFTVNLLKDNAPKLGYSTEMKTWVKEVAAPDGLTVQFTLNQPNPRFFFDYFQFHEDIGIQIVPEHIFKGQDPNTFTNFDLEKGWPVVTGPYRLVKSDSQQKIWDRRDDWWGAKLGFAPLPAPERLVFLPGFDPTKQVELLIGNEAETTFVLRTGDVETAIQRNPKIQSWTGAKPPYGNVDYWTPVLGFNDSKPPYNDPDLRWAVNYAINRDEILKIAYKGGGEAALVPFANFPALRTFLDPLNDLLRRYPVGTFDLAKSAQIIQSKGYAKDSGGFWAKDGKRLSLGIVTFSLFEDFTPVLVAQLRKGGFDASFKMPANFGTLISGGEAEAYVWGGNLSVETPLDTVKMYRAGGSPFYWSNPTYDKLVDQMAVTGSDNPALKMLFHQAMDIWLKELVAIPLVQLYARTPFNTTYWTGWPDEKTPYINTIFIHRTFQLIVQSLKPAGG
jgi:peptide/nickel transport system substrate-binding protein